MFLIAIIASLLATGTVSPILPGAGDVATGFTAQCAAGANVTVTVPAGIQANDIIVVVASSLDNQTHAITGYTQIQQCSVGTTPNFTQLSAFWKRTTGTEANPTITRGTTTGDICGSVIVLRGAIATGNPYEAVSSSCSTATATPLTTTGITATTNSGMTMHVFGAGITTNSAGTFPTPGGSATRGMGATDAARIGQGGATTNRAVIGAAYTILPIAAATGNATVTFGGGTGTRAGMLIQFPPAGGTNPFIWNPVQQPPNAKDINGVDTTSQQLIVQDQNPAGSGDLVGIFRTDALTAADRWYLFYSTNAGADWTYVLVSSGTPPTLALDTRYQSLCQDTVNYKLHLMTYDASGGTPVYNRAILTYTGSHVSGWTWDAADVTGPAFDVAGDITDAAGHINMREAIDGAGNHILVVLGVDQPNTAGLLARLVVARTTGLAPTGSTSWFKLTAHTTVGVDVIQRRFSTAGVNAGTLPLDVFSRVDPNESSHDSDCAFAQIANGGDVNMWIGEMFYNDTSVVVSHIERFRFTIAGGSQDWALDTSTGNGIAVSTSTGAQSQPCMGNAVGTQHFVWFTWGDGFGLHVMKINASGVATAAAFVSPDASTGTGTVNQVWWNSAINVRSDEQTAYISWGRYDQASVSHYFVSYFDSSWHTTDITIPFNTPNNAFGYQMAMWTSTYATPNGIGVFTYPFVDWDTTPGHHHYYTMIYAGLLPPLGPQIDTTACGGTSIFNCPQASGTTATSITTPTPFSTVIATELICAIVAQQGLGNSSTAITDSGLTLSTGWTRIGSCKNTTTNDSEIHCAVTSAVASGITVTATFTATSVASSTLTVIPFSSSATSLPTNYVCATNTSGAATLNITVAAANSIVIESGADTADTTSRTPTANATIVNPKAGATGFVWGGYTGPLATGSTAVGTTLPTSTLWGLNALEILAPGGAASVFIFGRRTARGAGQ